MPLPPLLQTKLVNRFRELITEGEYIHQSMKVTPGEWIEPWLRTQEPYRTSDQYSVDWQRFVKWRANSVSLLHQVIPTSNIHRASIDTFRSLSNQKGHLEYGIETLKALCDDFQNGFLDDLMRQIEAEIAGDYLGQATSLLGEEDRHRFDYVPAAVLSGAVLERTLKTLCVDHNPPIPIATPDGRPLTMGPLIDSLKAAAVFNELLAKQLRACDLPPFSVPDAMEGRVGTQVTIQ